MISAQDGIDTQVASTGDQFDITGGQLSSDGGNLFQSFEQFDLSADQSANFIVPSQVNSVFGRIIGGQASIIDGQVQTTGGNQPDLYLINPAGILLGPDVLLNLSGSFTATAATGIEFADGLFTASDRTAAADDATSLNGEPTAFEFATTQAGPVVNLGSLEVSDGERIALVGGTVLNVGTLSAPTGQVAIAAIAGEGLIRISQGDQALSFEIDIQDLAEAGDITPATIGEMLTGSSFDQEDSDATALVVNPDGTVQLGNEPQTIVETGGWAIASGTLATEGRSGGQVNVLGDQIRLSGVAIETANIKKNEPTGIVSIEATNGITLDNLLDNELEFETGTNVTFRANNNNGTGRFGMAADATLSAPSGTIDIYGAGINVGHIRTDISNDSGGDIRLISSEAVTATAISTNSYSRRNQAGRGGNVLIEAENGDITLRTNSIYPDSTQSIKTWSYQDGGNNAESGGDVTLTASGSINIDADIRTQSSANNNAGDAGAVTLTARTGNITADRILTSSAASRNNASRGGSVSLSAPSGHVTISTIDSTSRTDNNNSEAGGDVYIEADSISIDRIDTSSTAANNAERAGGVDLSTNGNISIGTIVASSSSDLNAAEGSSADGAVRIVSTNGGISILEALNTSGTKTGSDASIEAGTNISIGGLIDTTGGDRSGNVSLRANDGRITTAGIITATGNDARDESGQVSLFSSDNIKVEFIDARGNSSNTDSNITIDAQESIVVTGTVPNSNASITTAGAEEGNIQIIYGNDERSLYDFSIARQGNIENSRETVSPGITDESIEMESIILTNRGLRDSIDTPKVPETPETPKVPETPQSPAVTATDTEIVRAHQVAADNADAEAAPAFTTVETVASEEETFSLLETSIGTEFSQYLQSTASGTKPSIASVDKVQRTLEKVESATGASPALVYVYFVPDAASEQTNNSLAERAMRPDDQLEVMLMTQSGGPIRHRLWGVTRSQVETTAHALKDQVNNQFSKRSQYLVPAQQLYSWIMQPIVQELEEQQINSLGFVLDTGLRTLPLAALHSGERFLIEDYSIGLLPTFSLTNFEYSSHESLNRANVLAMGASKFEQQPDLPAVDVELTLIANDLWQGESFINEAFVVENLAEQVQSKRYSVVHLATHAAFNSGDLENSYIQMWNERLSLTDIDRLKLDEADIDLIVLSACNTALGDAGSEYGFAGFAVNAGSQSALASLWPVSDEGTLGFMTRFYSQLRREPFKSEALRAAQIELLNGEVGIEDGYVYGPESSPITYLPSLALSGRWDFSHPFYWSTFTMIGNPW